MFFTRVAEPAFRNLDGSQSLPADDWNYLFAALRVDAEGVDLADVEKLRIRALLPLSARMKRTLRISATS